MFWPGSQCCGGVSLCVTGEHFESKAHMPCFVLWSVQIVTQATYQLRPFAVHTNYYTDYNHIHLMPKIHTFIYIYIHIWNIMNYDHGSRKGTSRITTSWSEPKCTHAMAAQPLRPLEPRVLNGCSVQDDSGNIYIYIYIIIYKGKFVGFCVWLVTVCVFIRH